MLPLTKAASLRLIIYSLFCITALFHLPLAVQVSAQIQESERKRADDIYDKAVNALQRPQSLEEVIKAREDFLKCLEIYRRINDVSGQIRTLRLLGAALSMEGKADESRKAWEDGLKLAQENKELSEQAAILTNLASYYSDIADNYTSLKLYEQALGITRQLVAEKKPRALDIMGIILGNLAARYIETGEFQKAIDYSNQARDIAKQLKDRPGEAAILVNLGVSYINKGLYTDAASTLDEALSISRDQQTKDPDTEARALNNLGLLHFFLGQYDQAMSYWAQSVKVSEPLSNMGLINQAKGGIGVTLRALGRHQEAKTILEEALEIARKAQDNRSVVYWIGNLAGLYSEIKDNQKSIRLYEEAIKLTRATGDTQARGRFSHGLGVTYLREKQLPKALQNFHSALRIAEAADDPTLRWNAYHGIALVQRDLKRLSPSRNSFERALKVLETLRGSVQKDAYKTSLLEDKQSFFYDFIDLLIEQRDYERAFEICEAARARAFVDLLATGLSEADNPIRLKIKPLESLEERKAALSALASTTKDQKTRKAVEDERAGNAKRIEEFISSLDPEIRSLVNVPPVKMREVRHLASRKRATILSYFVMPKRLLIWVVKPDGRLYPPKVVDVPSTELQEEISLTRDGLSNASSDLPSLRKRLLKLASWLVDPVARLLPHRAEDLVIVIPHRDILTLPLAPLVSKEGDYFIEKHTLVYAPAVQVYKFLDAKARGNRRGCSAALVGNPRYAEELGLSELPGAEEEVREIEGILRQRGCHVGPPLIGSKATEPAVREALNPDISIIHFATHGLFVKDNPLKSAIALTSPPKLRAGSFKEDGFLTVAESFGLPVKATLLVLSNCESGRGQVTSDGILGFSRGFMYGGAESVMVSLWRVNDAATKEEMVTFYKQYGGGVDKARALRRAQLFMLRALNDGRIKSYATGRTLEEHPAHWSAFVLFGNAG